MRVWALLLVCCSAAAQVPYERIVNAAKEPGNWLTYSGNYLGHRFSPLTQLSPANVKDLHDRSRSAVIAAFAQVFTLDAAAMDPAELDRVAASVVPA